MKKALVCLLAITLVLFIFTACDNSTSTPDTGSIPRATEDQIKVIEFVGQKVSAIIRTDPLPTGATKDPEKGIYNFDNVIVKEGETEIGKINGGYDEETPYVDCSYIENSTGKTYSYFTKMEKQDGGIIYIVNGQKCLVYIPAT